MQNFLLLYLTALRIPLLSPPQHVYGFHLVAILYRNIDQTLVNSLHRLLNCEKGGLDFHVITTEYRTCSLYTHETPNL